MDIHLISTKEDINLLVKLIKELDSKIEGVLKPSTLPKYLTSKDVMQLLQVKEDCLRTMRMTGVLKYVEFGKWKRYPANQFLIRSNQDGGSHG